MDNGGDIEKRSHNEYAPVREPEKRCPQGRDSAVLPENGSITSAVVNTILAVVVKTRSNNNNFSFGLSSLSDLQVVCVVEYCKCNHEQ